MLSIGDFSKVSQVSKKALRYYDEINLLKPSYTDVASGYRYYDVDQLETILLIKRLKEYTFSLEEIKQVLNSGQDQVLLQQTITQKKLEITRKMQDYSLLLDRLDNDLYTLEKGKKLMTYLQKIEVKLTEVPERNIRSIRKTMNVNEYGQCLAELFEKITIEKLTPTAPPMTIYHSPDFDPENADMELAVPVAEQTKETQILSSSLCAFSTYVGPYAELDSVYSKLVKWIEEKGYKMAGAPFEIYQTDPNTTEADKNVVDVYFPVML
ncbi:MULTISPECIES: MerR family transcriptional regulator [unclassified Enterococcus]|uniref:MerR family transcriptional regulator n=1 Tax=unclassified Enterococcus TaxID=2608891 RepID=UPI001CE2002D|nr:MULTISPECIES: MerR family transcriptional regulator [unclassified Enterococcus]MCA5012470.1 MerR family transcriptional regulator [Enterococcus sp. S23]MCA5015721.1 MerR family transcriptional regulator [Enterococcus sp. S22(2020)]